LLRHSALFAALAIALLLIDGARLCPAQPSAPVIRAAPQSQAGVRDPYVPRVPARAIAYHRSQYALALYGIAWKLLGLWLLVQTGLSVRMRDAVYRTLRLRLPEADAPPPFRALALFFVLYAALLLLWSLPYRLAWLALEHRYGFSRQSVIGFFGDALLDMVFSYVSIPLFWGGYWLYARSPRRWLWWLWALLVPLLFFQMILQPVVIAPAYNRFTPLAPGNLHDDILALAARAGITGGRVFVEDTSRRTRHVNAYVTGLGPTTRIVINDTALQTLPEDQLLAMVGHEMGHYVECHIWVHFVTGVFGAGFFLWLAARLIPGLVLEWGRRHGLRGVIDLAALPVIALTLTLFLLAQAPIENAISRTLEHRADAFGLRVTHLNDATARLLVGFAERDYTDSDPPALFQFWFGSHPPLAERIAFARKYP
jgi:Zn-dependent protease with chaperone function